MTANLESLDDLLSKLIRAIPEIKAVVIVTAEGMPIASMTPQEVDDVKVSAMVSALLSISEQVIIDMKKGDFHQLNIKGSEGFILVLQASPNEVLMVSTTSDVRLGLLFLELNQTIGGILQNNPIVEKALEKILSIFKEKSIKELSIEKKTLLDIFDDDVLFISEIDGFPTLKPWLIIYFENNGVETKFQGNSIRFIKHN